MERTSRRAAAEDGEELNETDEDVVGTRLDEKPILPEVTAYVGLGSNMGERLGALRDAIRQLRTCAGVRVTGVSNVYETEAHVLPGQGAAPAFLNAVVALSTTLPARDLLASLLAVERAGGRQRDGRRWEARTVDLDLLLYGADVIDEPGLTVPHPRLNARRFVLAPLADLAPGVAVPGTGRTVTELLAACEDPHPVTRVDFDIT